MVCDNEVIMSVTVFLEVEKHFQLQAFVCFLHFSKNHQMMFIHVDNRMITVT